MKTNKYTHRTFIVFSLFTLFSTSLLAADTPNPMLVKKGKQLFTMKACSGCHTIGHGDSTGPDLKEIVLTKDTAWLKKWIKDPDAMVKSKDPDVMAKLKKYKTQMPNLGLTDPEVDALLAYVRSEALKAAK